MQTYKYVCLYVCLYVYIHDAAVNRYMYVLP